ncbi:ATPase family associated with various cellular activities (AAA) family protein [Theileria parva strain Muguga]|uniref:ATPase family associated with various cellular activities (AAA) family protein n=1 Tax=Theileria parva strain Muguga TaxID=333668 RepID=UPI001C620D28|nr:ATPase family associated with various cellular activities (AAA) family protein [Theileria parva strain Muguga]EAN34396.2 ATPase family associated with various cellular activities (AAA) family protein [Theileria parva strain Muguga]
MSVKILENRLKTILEKRGLLWPPESFSKFHITCCKIEGEECEVVLIDDILEDLRESFYDYKRQKINILKNIINSILNQTIPDANMKKKRNINEDKANLGLSMDLDEPIINLNNTLTNNYKLTNTNTINNNKINGINGINPVNNPSNDKQNDLDEEELDYKFIPELDVKTKLKDVGGIDKIKGEIEDLVINPLKYPQLYKHLGVQPTKGVLLHGPPGSGKTKLAEAIAGEIGCPFFRVAATEIVTGMSGESENRLRSLFEQAKACAPSIIFLDELDSITPKRENTFREMEKRIVSQLGICMDSLQNHFVIVIGATNRQEYVDSMIRRNGRFDREISMGIPNQESRYDILQALSVNIKIADDVDFEEIANLTPGFVGADLQAVLRESAIHSISRLFKSYSIANTDMNDLMKNLYINREDFLIGINKVQPSSKREGFITIPDVTWSKIGALSFLKSELEKQIVFPIKYKKLYQRFGIGISAGILLYGPPGCGKTLLAKAISNECNANFISIKGPEILNKYVGESEKAIRLIFQRAATSSPCIIFFDEVDSLCSIRNDSNQVYERIVNQLLTEMDGIQNREYVYIIAATNRPDIIDPAILRPGRLEKLFYVPLPDEDDRVDILLKLTSDVPVDPLVNFKIIAQRTNGFSGADLASLCREASIIAIDEIRMSMSESSVSDYKLSAPENSVLKMEHFQKALLKVKPSVKQQQIDFYHNFRLKYS